MSEDQPRLDRLFLRDGKLLNRLVNFRQTRVLLHENDKYTLIQNGRYNAAYGGNVHGQTALNR